MGDWMGNNFDRFTLYSTYKPLPRLLLNFRFERIRKGSEGTLLDQYFAEPQPSFLFGQQWNSSEFLIQGRFEIVHHLYVSALLSIKNRQDLVNNTQNTRQQSQIGLNFGW
jgi:hypothetical protein